MSHGPKHIQEASYELLVKYIRRTKEQIEIEAALQRGIPVVPILVRGAHVPTESDLPETLTALAYRNGEITRRVPWVAVASSIAMATSALLSGIYVLLPTFIAANTICHAISARRRHRTQVILLGTLALLVPTTLELLGLVPATHEFINGTLTVTAASTTSPPPAARHPQPGATGLEVTSAQDVGQVGPWRPPAQAGGGALEELVAVGGDDQREAARLVERDDG